VSRPETLRHSLGLNLEAGPGSIAAKLVVLEGPDAGLEKRVGSVLTLGSSSECDVLLSDPTVSRKHALLAPLGPQLRLRDLGSSNGTRVGGRRVVEVEIDLGTTVHIGNTVFAVYPAWHVREVELSTRDDFGSLFGRSPAMREVFSILERVAPTDVSVLIDGESGTGKELVARSLHEHSARKDRAYVVFDCTQAKPELVESELFGHKKGAFTGATADRHGVFEQADGGTLFLDELGELPTDLQAKLLRTLETGEVKGVGADAPRLVDVRVVAATNRDLKAEVARGNFRSDLMYRLDVVKIRMPPLRERPEDVPGLVERLLGGRCASSEPIAGPNLHQLMSFDWPGNVRELRNVVERALALAPRGAGAPRFSQLIFNLGRPKTPSSTPSTLPGLDPLLPYKEAKEKLLERFDCAYLEALMAAHGQNISGAARVAGLSRKHLYELLHRNGMAASD